MAPKRASENDEPTNVSRSHSSQTGSVQQGSNLNEEATTAFNTSPQTDKICRAWHVQSTVRVVPITFDSDPSKPVNLPVFFRTMILGENEPAPAVSPIAPRIREQTKARFASLALEVADEEDLDSSDEDSTERVSRNPDKKTIANRMQLARDPVLLRRGLDFAWLLMSTYFTGLPRFSEQPSGTDLLALIPTGICCPFPLAGKYGDRLQDVKIQAMQAGGMSQLRVSHVVALAMGLVNTAQFDQLASGVMWISRLCNTPECMNPTMWVYENGSDAKSRNACRNDIRSGSLLGPCTRHPARPCVPDLVRPLTDVLGFRGFPTMAWSIKKDADKTASWCEICKIHLEYGDPLRLHLWSFHGLFKGRLTGIRDPTPSTRPNDDNLQLVATHQPITHLNNTDDVLEALGLSSPGRRVYTSREEILRQKRNESVKKHLREKRAKLKEQNAESKARTAQARLDQAERRAAAIAAGEDPGSEEEIKTPPPIPMKTKRDPNAPKQKPGRKPKNQASATTTTAAMATTTATTTFTFPTTLTNASYPVNTRPKRKRGPPPAIDNDDVFEDEEDETKSKKTRKTAAKKN